MQRRGQAPPGFSLNTDEDKVADKEIVSYLQDYRKDPFLKVEGGAKILSKYIRRDHKAIVNHKKVARLCKLHQLGLPIRMLT